MVVVQASGVGESSQTCVICGWTQPRSPSRSGRGEAACLDISVQPGSSCTGSTDERAAGLLHAHREEGCAVSHAHLGGGVVSTG